MKRSEINRYMAAAEALFAEYHIALPPWAAWPPERWNDVGSEAAEIAWHGLGWDLTDFGSGDYERIGLLLFTLRNGRLTEPVSRKTYAEKLLVSGPEQVLPTHFHWHKTEDIIVRAGGRMVIRLWNADDQDGLADAPVVVAMDGIRRQFAAGETVVLGVGESITLEPRVYHTFWGEPGGPPCIMGEVSAVNDDHTDNRFLDGVGRFPSIEEDVAPRHLLCNDYPAHLLGSGR
ncbi:MAG: D-lyxose/D-mannose family sugar isomerase [Armatimonadetes bacterium]|nr:D-lyxose/D-mannose family sugar isomerase [Armatimonadota bacterium]